MNFGPLAFLAAFFALALSWFGFVLGPQLQVGQLQQTVSAPGNDTYPLNRAGLAQQGAQVYRANGCASCHSQNVRQFGVMCEVVMTDAGTNKDQLISALRSVKNAATDQEIGELLTAMPKTVLTRVTPSVADDAIKLLKDAGAKSQRLTRPTGPEMARAWGERQSVAEDYLYEYPVMLGSQRIGPDLATVGKRKPDANWHLRHLYAPRTEVTGSPMPSYRFLFERTRANTSSPEATGLPAGIVPKPEAIALVAYLTSLRDTAPLSSAPYSTAAQPPGTGTNAPGAGASASTNSTATTTPAK